MCRRETDGIGVKKTTSKKVHREAAECRAA